MAAVGESIQQNSSNSQSEKIVTQHNDDSNRPLDTSTPHKNPDNLPFLTRGNVSAKSNTPDSNSRLHSYYTNPEPGFLSFNQGNTSFNRTQDIASNLLRESGNPENWYSPGPTNNPKVTSVMNNSN